MHAPWPRSGLLLLTFALAGVPRPAAADLIVSAAARLERAAVSGPEAGPGLPPPRDETEADAAGRRVGHGGEILPVLLITVVVWGAILYASTR